MQMPREVNHMVVDPLGPMWLTLLPPSVLSSFWPFTTDSTNSTALLPGSIWRHFSGLGSTSSVPPSSLSRFDALAVASISAACPPLLRAPVGTLS